MKIKMWLFFTISLSYVITTTYAVRSSIYAPFHIISLKDITADERRQIAYIQQKLERAKRSGSSSGSGSGEIVMLLKTAIGNGIKKKIGQLTMASAAASGAFSKTSSSGGHHTDYYPPPPDHSYESHYDHPQKSFDFWNLKKSVFNTLLQAVKAIKGGAIAVKGQLVKGGGKLISASGHLVSSQGDAITHLGKKIATSAVLVPWMGSSGHPHTEYESVESHYSAPSAPSEVYHHPSHSGPSLDYHVPDNYPPHPHEGTSGLLILRKATGQENSHQDYYPSPTNNYQSSPTFGSVLGKLFSASSSLDPHKPELYGDRPIEQNIDSYHADFISPDNDNDIVPSASGLIKHKISTSVKAKLPKKTTQSHSNYAVNFEESPTDISQYLPNTISPSYNQPNQPVKQEASYSGESIGTNKPTDRPSPYFHLKPTPFDPSENINIISTSNELISNKPDDIISGSQSSTSNLKTMDIINSFQYPSLHNTQQSFNPLQGYSEFSDPTIYLSPPPVISTISSDFTPEPNLKNNFLMDVDFPNIQHSQLVESSRPSPYLETPKTNYIASTSNNEPSTDTSDTTTNFEKNSFKDLNSEASTFNEHFKNTYDKFTQNYDVVPSISFELGPEGPKRLTKR